MSWITGAPPLYHVRRCGILVLQRTSTACRISCAGQKNTSCLDEASNASERLPKCILVNPKSIIVNLKTKFATNMELPGYPGPGVRVAEWSKAPDSSSGPRMWAWVQIPLLTDKFCTLVGAPWPGYIHAVLPVCFAV